MDETGLQSEEHWDWETARKGRRDVTRRAVVSVAFDRETFQRVAECAERSGMAVSAFIRAAALEKAAQQVALVATSWSSGNRGAAFVPNAPKLSTGSVVVRKPEPETPMATG